LHQDGSIGTGFSWIAFYEDPATRLLWWEGRQAELIAFLDALRTRSLKVTPLEDRDATGARLNLREIDPFTFFGSFNRAVGEDQRREITTG
jgi:5-methylcytosine-specific restriction protein B